MALPGHIDHRGAMLALKAGFFGHGALPGHVGHTEVTGRFRKHLYGRGSNFGGSRRSPLPRESPHQHYVNFNIM